MITTGYGTWYNHTQSNTSPEADILDAINGGDNDWQRRMETSGALDAIASDYRDAVQAALPEGIYISGDEFNGLHHTDPNYTDQIGDFDIASAIKEIDLYAIIQKHDVDL